MGEWHSALLILSLVLIARILDVSQWPPMPPLSTGLRCVIALAWAAVVVVLSPRDRQRRVAGGMYTWTIVIMATQFGDGLLGLHAWWQRWLLGLVLSSPFVYLLLTSGPSLLTMRKGRRRGGGP